MSWWIWTIVSIAGYLVAGFITGCGLSYVEGRRGHSTTNDLALALGLWPIVVLAGCFNVAILLYEWFNRRGMSYTGRKLARGQRAEMKKQQAEIDGFARQYGIKRRELH